ncbi:uncharacterized protein LOC131440325 isoform X2 [Malaya genurostris]|uniref:uncharacterized protein LOC131440325 isoform X2 n=1 Tax=Malaya genurostris TaxID=325434 RepID=UPI0026F4082A|nr:uncharacterized protein LOC131440325 isoform X2 [Malaya genurostris]
MAYIRCIILTTTFVLLIHTLFPGSCCSTEALTISNDDNDNENNDNLLNPVQLISSKDENDANDRDLPRPFLIPVDTSQIQPKRMKLKTPNNTKRRKHSNKTRRNGTATKRPKHKRKPTMQSALQSAARKGLEAMIELFDKREPEMVRKGIVLDPSEPGALLSKFSSSDDSPEDLTKAGYAAMVAAKKLKESTNVEYVALGRQAPSKISLKRTPLEGMCPSREPPPCVPASRRYRTHDGTCNNRKKPRWGAAQMPFHRFLAPDYTDGVEGIRRSINGSPLPSARFVSLVVHGTRQEEAPVTMMLALWGQLLDHDLTATAQPRSLNGSTPRCCGGQTIEDSHPSCLPIKVPLDDPWLSPLGVRCLEFLRSAPAQRRDCLLSWREQTNQVTSYIDASPIYSSNPRTSDNARIFRSGLLLFGRGPPSEDVCFRAALANQCIRPGDARSGEQPGLLMLHMIWVNEHNQIATQLSDINPHWSDEKLYQETRRIVGALFQHITYREFLPIVLGKQVCNLFNLELESNGYYKGYDPGANPTVTNEFSAAAFRFGHSLIQGSYMRADRFHRFIPNNVTLHDESADGDLGGPGSLHRLVRGMVNQRALKRDEFITAELTNHLFQTSRFPFGLDLAAINIQRGRDHGIQPYINWRIPCGLTPIREWEDLDRVMGPASAHRLRKAYRFIDDIDLFVGGLAERPVVGGIVGPTFSCIIAQQFSNLRRGDRFWYENPGFESSFTPAQLDAIRQVAFSQILCRALGGGTLQPHAFLPADIVQNERLSCDSKLMAPIDLEPWTERDPFTRPNDVSSAGQSENLIDLETVQALLTTTSTTTRQPTQETNVINNVDFIPNGNVGLHIPSNGQIVLDSLATSIHNKLDLSTTRPSTRPTTPSKEPMLTAVTVINNKIDLTGTTTPPSRKPTRRTTPKKRPTLSTHLITNNVDLNFKRDTTVDETNLTTTNNNHTMKKRDVSHVNLSKLFTKEDNANLFSQKNSALRRGYYPNPAPTPPSDYDDINNYDYNSDADPPVFVKPGYGYEEPVTDHPPNTYYEDPPTPPPQPPYCGYSCYNPPTMTTYNPYGLDTRRPTRTTTRKRGLSNKIVNNNFDYEPNDNRQQTQRPKLQRTTTSRTVFQRPGLLVINDNRPNDQSMFLSLSSPSSSSSSSTSVLNSNAFLQHSKNPASFAASQSVFSVDPRPQYISRPSTHQSVHSPNFFQKQTNHRNPLKELRIDQDRLPSKLISTLKQDYDYDSLVPDAERVETLNVHEHDGYLRPEQNKYEPLKKTSDLETYRNYSLYNVRNHISAQTYDIPQSNRLWTQTDSLRYAARYPQTLLELDDGLDQFVRPYIYQDKITHVNEHTEDINSTLSHFLQLTDSPRIDELSNVTVTDKIDRNDLNQDKLQENATDVDQFQETNSDQVANVSLHQTDEDKNDQTTKKNRNEILLTTVSNADTRPNDDKPTLTKNGDMTTTDNYKHYDKSREQTAQDIDITGDITSTTEPDHSKMMLAKYQNSTNTNLQDSVTDEMKQRHPNRTDHTNYDLPIDGTSFVHTNNDSLTYQSTLENSTKPKTTDNYLTDVSTEVNKRQKVNDEVYANITRHEIPTTNLQTLQQIYDKSITENNNNLSPDCNDRQRTESVLPDTNTSDIKQLTKQDKLSYHSIHERTYEETNHSDPDKLPNDFIDLPNSMELITYADTLARTPLRDTIQSVLSLDDPSADAIPNTDELSKLPRLDKDENQPIIPTSTERPKSERRTTNSSRKRLRPTHSKRPAHHQTTNHGSNNDRKPPGIALVPFVLLTSIERPDNWVMFNVAKSKKRKPLPEVPLLKSELFSLSELPKPISADD